MAESKHPGVIEAVRAFKEQFGSSPEVAVFAPGRVNLIGEHVDYNDGFVLPFALPFRTIVVGKKSTSNTTRVYSTAFKGTAEFIINDTLSKGSPVWANYVKGTIFQYLKDLPTSTGVAFDAVIWSDVPLGSGLSSSASLEVAVSTFLEKLYFLRHVGKVDKALRCQKAEHTFADTPCGIMDQYISSLGQAGKLLLIDCRTHEATLVPFGSGTKQDVVVLVTNSNVKHQLSGSEYPTRVRQCQEAVTALKKMFPSVKALRDVTLDMLSKVQYSMNTEAYQRAKHCVTEDIRTLGTVEALKVGDFAKVGNYMSESHDSLSKDFEVSCDELDILKELALKVPGVYGSRMTGGGFGGCTVTLVEKSAVPQLKEFLKKEYFTRTQIECEFYDAEPSAGAGPIDLEPYLGWSFFFDAESKAALQGVVNWAVPLAAVGLIVGIAINASRNKR